MGPRVFDFQPPERFVAGTVGEPGDRTFFLQARGGGQVVSVVLEKVQVALLADKLEELLAEAANRFGVTVPDEGDLPEDNDPLDTPLDEEFRVGTLGLAWDADSGTVLIEAIAAVEAGPEEAEGLTADELTAGELVTEPDEDSLDRLRVRLTPEETRAFIDRARRVVAAGRSPCPLCGNPLDPSGHLCPRHNGYRR